MPPKHDYSLVKCPNYGLPSCGCPEKSSKKSHKKARRVWAETLNRHINWKRSKKRK